MKRADTANRRTSSRLATGVLVALCATLAVHPVAQAMELQLQRGSGKDKKLEPPPKREAAAPRAGLSVDRLIKQVESRYKARVVNVGKEKRTKDGRSYYEMRLLSEENRVWNIKVDAESGKTL
jgi:uncharacterized membrane protein YkoI